MFKDFQEIFQKFDLAAIREAELAAEAAVDAEAAAEAAKQAADLAEAKGDEAEDGDKALSKRKKKLARRMKVAELKQVPAHPPLAFHRNPNRPLSVPIYPSRSAFSSNKFK